MWSIQRYLCTRYLVEGMTVGIGAKNGEVRMVVRLGAMVSLEGVAGFLGELRSSSVHFYGVTRALRTIERPARNEGDAHV